MGEARQLTVSLTVDYGNGNHKTFSRLQVFAPADMVDVLDAAKSRPPGLDFTFTEGFVDRGGRVNGAITMIDGVKNTEDQVWRTWVGTKAFGGVQAHTEQTVSPTVEPNVQDGDAISFKLTE